MKLAAGQPASHRLAIPGNARLVTEDTSQFCAIVSLSWYVAVLFYARNSAASLRSMLASSLPVSWPAKDVTTGGRESFSASMRCSSMALWTRCLLHTAPRLLMEWKRLGPASSTCCQHDNGKHSRWRPRRFTRSSAPSERQWSSNTSMKRQGKGRGARCILCSSVQSHNSVSSS